MKKLKGSEEAVSAVIGVVLMVGLTVVMISAVAVSVLAFTLPESAPQAKIVVVEAEGGMGGDDNLYENKIVLKHKGGDALNENNTKIIITGKGCAYTGDMGSSCFLKDMRATYGDLAGENCCDDGSYIGEIVNGISWDAGETITLYGSDGRYLPNPRNSVDYKWKLQAGSTVLVTIIDTPTNQVIAFSQAKVKQA